MVFPYGVGVGDFIASIELIHSVKQAVQTTGGSKEQYGSFVAVMDGLEHVLQRLNEIPLTEEQKVNVRAYLQYMKSTTETFAKSKEKHKHAFGRETSKTWWRELPSKIQWQRKTREDIKGYAIQLLQHTTNLQALLGQMQFSAELENHEATLAVLQTCTNKLEELKIVIQTEYYARRMEHQTTQSTLNNINATMLHHECCQRAKAFALQDDTVGLTAQLVGLTGDILDKSAQQQRLADDLLTSIRATHAQLAIVARSIAAAMLLAVMFAAIIVFGPRQLEIRSTEKAPHTPLHESAPQFTPQHPVSVIDRDQQSLTRSDSPSETNESTTTSAPTELKISRTSPSETSLSTSISVPTDPKVPHVSPSEMGAPRQTAFADGGPKIDSVLYNLVGVDMHQSETVFV